MNHKRLLLAHLVRLRWFGHKTRFMHATYCLQCNLKNHSRRYLMAHKEAEYCEAVSAASGQPMPLGLPFNVWRDYPLAVYPMHGVQWAMCQRCTVKHYAFRTFGDPSVVEELLSFCYPG